MSRVPASAQAQPAGDAVPTVLRRRTRLRRTAALGGMLAVVGGLVTLRAAVTPPPRSALASTGLARSVAPSAPKAPNAKKAAHVAGARSGSAHKPSASTAPSRVRRATGQAFDVGYGTVQVRVTVRGRRILDVTALSLPSGGHSSDISGFAGPQLRREALAAQSAHIDAVSGATYTSAGYAQSLQSALDTAFAG